MIFIHFQRTDNEEVNLLKDRRGKFPPKFDKAKKKRYVYLCLRKLAENNRVGRTDFYKK